MLSSSSVGAVEYRIEYFGNPDIPEKSLIGHDPQYKPGDVLNIIDDLAANSAVGNILKLGGNYTINGNSRNTLDGGGFSGFTVSSLTLLNINNFGAQGSAFAVSGFVNAAGSGGVFSNSGELSIASSAFSNNKAVSGSVVYNTGSLKVSSVDFLSGSASDSGGAIASAGGTFNASDAFFQDNHAGTNGGALSLSGTSSSLSASSFAGNTADALGGAIFNNAYLLIQGGSFSDNTAGMSGGAIYNAGNLFINNGFFVNNAAGNAGNGGAVMSDGGNVLINNTVFQNNTAFSGGAIFSSPASAFVTIVGSSFIGNQALGAGGRGGAVVGSSEMTIISSRFTNNNSQSGASALSFDGTILNIGASATSMQVSGNLTGTGFYTNDTVFEGNTSGDGSGAVHIFQGASGVNPVVNLNAASSSPVIFNDLVVFGTNGGANSGQIILNINQEMEYQDMGGSKQSYQAPTDGKIIFNNTLENNTETLFNMYSGNLVFQDVGAVDNISMTLYGGNISLQNDALNRLNINTLTLAGDTGLNLFADLSGRRSDFLSINSLSENGGTLKLNGIHLTGAASPANISIAYADKTLADGSSLASLAYDNVYTSFFNSSAGTMSVYKVTTGTDSGNSVLQFDYIGSDGLATAFADTASRSYSGTGNETLSSWAGGDNRMLGSKLVIYGQDYTIAGSGGISGIAVGYTNQSQVLEISNIEKLSGFTTSYTSSATKYSYGGALAVQGQGGVSLIMIDNVFFADNLVGGTDNTVFIRAYGGAVSVSGSSQASTLRILNSGFENNRSMGKDAYGGAIAIALGQAIVENSDFEGNGVFSRGMHGYGGAIALMHNDSRLYADNNVFRNNFVDTITGGTGYQKALGGAFHSEQSVFGVISNSLFEGNYTYGYAAAGGAVSANVSGKGTLTFKNSIFRNNHASAVGSAFGGAIHNDKNSFLNIVSDGGDTLFEDNYVEKLSKNNSTGVVTTVSRTSEAIYNLGTINLNAAAKNKITINDKFNGSAGVVNINQSGIQYSNAKNTMDAPVLGTVILNNAVYNQTLNLYGGTLAVGSDTSWLAAGDSYFNDVVLNSYGTASFDTQNGALDALTLAGLSLNGTLNLSLDVDLASRKSDMYVINSAIAGTGTLVISDVKILSDMHGGINTVDTTFINQSVSNALVADTAALISTNEYIYEVALVNNNTTLRFTKANASLGLPEAVADSLIVGFSATKDELVGEWLEPTYNKLQGSLTIQGNEHSILAEDHLTGIVVDGSVAGTLLNVIDAGGTVKGMIKSSWKSFNNAFSNINGGTIRLTHSVFTNNISKSGTAGTYGITADGKGAVVYNESGTVTVNGGYFKDNTADDLGGAIYNASSLVLNSSAGNDLLFSGNKALAAQEVYTYANDIYQEAGGSTVIGGDKGKVKINSGFAGAGTVNKTGKNEFVLGADSDNSKYTGSFLLEDGLMTVEKGAVFFGGQSEMTGGSLNWEAASKLPSSAVLSINNGVLNVRGGGVFTINDKVRVNDRAVRIAVGKDSVLENTTNGFTISGGSLTGYDDGAEITYGTFKNSGNLTIVGDNTGFKGMFVQAAGTAVVEAGAKIFRNGDLQGGTIVFKDNSTLSEDATFTSANTENEKTVELLSNINSSSLMETIIGAANKNLKLLLANEKADNITVTLDHITLDEKINALTIRDNITYVGDISVGSDATLAFKAETFDVQFNNNITDINDNSVLSIIAQMNKTITLNGNSEVTGDGFVNKTGDGTFVLEGDGRSFVGTYNHDGGTLTVTQNGYLFAGEKNINQGSIDIQSNTGLYYSDIKLASGTSLTHASANLSGGTLDTGVLSFSGTGAQAVFKGIEGIDASGSPIKTEFILSGPISNPSAGTSNTLTFINADTVIEGDDYKDNTVYNFDNSKINLVSAGTDVSLRHAEFNKLTASNGTSLDFDVDFVQGSGGLITLQSDYLSAAGNSSVQTLAVGDIRIRNDHDNGATGHYSTTVLGDGLTFGTVADVASIATTAYEYSVSADDRDIVLNADGASDEYSLNAMNVLADTRYFMFSDKTSEMYNIGASLSATNAGKFFVLGYNGDSSHSTISGLLKNSPDIKGSLFNMELGTELTVRDLTIEDTSGPDSGSVARIGTDATVNANVKAYLENVVIRRAASESDGGALYNNGGYLEIDNAVIVSSSSLGDGGAVKNKSGKLSVFNTVLGTFSPVSRMVFALTGGDTGNTAVNGGALAAGALSENNISFSSIQNNTAFQNGGGIYNQGTVSLSDSTVLTGNMAQSGLGGAVYNTGMLNVSSSTGNDVLFENNADSSGINDIHQLALGTTTFNGTGGRIFLNGGISGTGDIIKTGISELVLGADSNNTGFTGKYAQDDGFLAVNGTFFGGESSVSGGTFTWNTTKAKSESAVLTVTGGDLNIYGSMALNNAGDTAEAAAKIVLNQNAFLKIDGGFVSMDKNGNPDDFANFDKWNGAIELDSGRLDYDLNKNSLLMANGGVLNLNGGELSLKGETFNGTVYSSHITDNVVVTLGDTAAPGTTATLLLDDKNTVVTIDGNDAWNPNGIINVKQGTFNYDSPRDNGSLIAQGGRVNIFGGVLTLASDDDLIAKGVEANLLKGAVLDLKAGTVVFDSSDYIDGTIQLLSSTGTMITDNLYNNANNANGRYKQDSGTLIVKNNTNFGLNSPESYISGGNVTVQDSGFTITARPQVFSADNLTLTNAVFTAAKEFSVKNDLNMTASLINSIDGKIEENHIENLIVGSGSTAGFAIDISSRDGTADSYILNSISTDAYDGAVINIASFAFSDIPVERTITFKVFDAGTVGDKIVFTATNQSIITPLGIYDLSSLGAGSYRATMIGLNNTAYRGQVSTLAAYQNQLAVNGMLFNHAFTPGQTGRTGKTPDKKAASDTRRTVFANGGNLWIKPYTGKETLKLAQGLHAKNETYGVLAGADFPEIEFADGWILVPTVYAGYNGAEQKFNGAEMEQDGGQGGVMGTFMTDDFEGSLLVYAGAYNNSLSANGYTDKVNNKFIGTAAKAIYSFRPADDITLQPTAMLSYNIFGGQDWVSTFGGVTMDSGMLRGLSAASGVNVIYNGRGWDTYGSVQYVYNFNEDVKGNVAGFDMAPVRMRRDYFEYGLGVSGKWDNGLSSYIQGTFRTGGRSGTGLQVGIEYTY